jgi:hypothetical protein
VRRDSKLFEEGSPMRSGHDGSNHYTRPMERTQSFVETAMDSYVRQTIYQMKDALALGINERMHRKTSDCPKLHTLG